MEVPYSPENIHDCTDDDSELYMNKHNLLVYADLKMPLFIVIV